MYNYLSIFMGFSGAQLVRKSTCSPDPGSVPGLGSSPGEGIGYPLKYSWASLGAQTVIICLQCGRPGFDPGLERSSGGHGNPLQNSCLKHPHGQRSLVGYSPWGHKESDRTERLCTVQQICHYTRVVRLLSRVRLFATQWTVACQAPLPMSFPRQEY